MSASKDDQKPAPAPGLHIDTDWKAQAQAEKKKLAEQAKAEAPASGGAAAGAAGGGRGAPPATFTTLLQTFITQAMFAMGAIPDPQTGRRVAYLDLARHHIDMLGVLEEKTKGNLSDEEQKLLATALYELRLQYLQLSKAAANQQMAGGPPMDGGMGGMGGDISGMESTQRRPRK